jgi:hypothetical protein
MVVSTTCQTRGTGDAGEPFLGASPSLGGYPENSYMEIREIDAFDGSPVLDLQGDDFSFNES